MAGKANFSVIRGDTFQPVITFTNKTSGTAVNLTGATVTFTVDAVQFTAVMVSAVAGTFKLLLTPVQTAALVVGIRTIAVKITYADTTVQTVITGNLVVS